MATIDKVELPSEADYAHVTSALGEAEGRMEAILEQRLRPVLVAASCGDDELPCELPTLEDIGALYVFLERVDQDRETLEAHADGIREVLGVFDYARVMYAEEDR